jgi:hypothetical protein
LTKRGMRATWWSFPLNSSLGLCPNMNCLRLLIKTTWDWVMSKSISETRKSRRDKKGP